MAESLRPVDSSTIQRSLAILEERYQQLREVGEKQITLWEAERTELQQQLSSQREALHEAHAARDALSGLTQTLQKDLHRWQQEHAALTVKNVKTTQQVEQLQHQIATMADALHQAQSSRDEQARHHQSLSAQLASLRQEQGVLTLQKETALAELSQLRQQLSSQAETLKRLRQLVPMPASLHR
jgi:chromosome segregation ATPase